MNLKSNSIFLNMHNLGLHLISLWNTITNHLSISLPSPNYPSPSLHYPRTLPSLTLTLPSLTLTLPSLTSPSLHHYDVISLHSIEEHTDISTCKDCTSEPKYTQIMPYTCSFVHNLWRPMCPKFPGISCYCLIDSAMHMLINIYLSFPLYIKQWRRMHGKGEHNNEANATSQCLPLHCVLTLNHLERLHLLQQAHS